LRLREKKVQTRRQRGKEQSGEERRWSRTTKERRRRGREGLSCLFLHCLP
jgi:hypothetical protein